MKQRTRKPTNADGSKAVIRSYDTSPDHVVVYSDHANVVSTGTETILSVYQTIPGYPDDETPRAQSTRMATIILNPSHALELGQLLLKHARALLDKVEDSDT